MIIRGGGAQTDLLLFNQYDVAAMIASFPFPVIAGIGHQINETITDPMAHTSVKAPSIAAETILAHNRDFEDELSRMRQSIFIQAQRTVSVRQQKLSPLNSTLTNETKSILQEHKDALSNIAANLTTKPPVVLRKKQNELDSLVTSFRVGTTRYLTDAANRLNHYSSLIKVMSPESILKRGFAMILRDSVIITDPTQLKKNETITIRMDGARIGAKIDTVTKDQTNINEHDL